MNTSTICHAAAAKLNDEYSILNTVSHLWNADPNSLVQIADDTSTKPDVLTMLASHADPRIRSTVADNPCTPDAILLQLAVDKSVDIRYQLAENHNIPLSVLFILAEDENPYVEARAVKTINRVDAYCKISEY